MNFKMTVKNCQMSPRIIPLHISYSIGRVCVSVRTRTHTHIQYLKFVCIMLVFDIPVCQVYVVGK